MTAAPDRWPLMPTLCPDDRRDLKLRAMQVIIDTIREHDVSPGTRLPSTRSLSRRLGISRNTAIAAIEAMAEQGVVEIKNRSGCYVASDPLAPARPPNRLKPAMPSPARDWVRRFSVVLPEASPRPPTAEFDFTYGQFDPTLFPTNPWRECERRALAVTEIEAWARDTGDADDPMLVDYLISTMLARQGIRARPEEIIVTLGGQQGRFLVAQLLAGQGTTTGYENPGMAETRQVLELMPTRALSLPMDDDGAIAGPEMAACDTIFLTPGHQCPTTAVMSLDRRGELLDCAARAGTIVVEDTFEVELLPDPLPALHGLDRTGGVIHIGSMSKLIAPGLRMGYVVAPAEVTRQLRALRRVMHRHPPGNNQRALALFLAHGHYGAFLRRAYRVLGERSDRMCAALALHLPEMQVRHKRGASTFWMTLPAPVPARELVGRAASQNLSVRPSVHFVDAQKGSTAHLQLSVSNLPAERIEEGVKRLSRVLRGLL